MDVLFLLNLGVVPQSLELRCILSNFAFHINVFFYTNMCAWMYCSNLHLDTKGLFEYHLLLKIKNLLLKTL